MRIDIITLFPEFFEPFKTHSIVGRAIKSGKVKVVTHNLREWASDKYKSVDDHPYGGGPGMVLRVDVVAPAIAAVRKLNRKARVILMTPQGKTYTQPHALALSKTTGLILICGHYEGFDERIRGYVDTELSVGDYVLTGGELPAMIVVDSVVRLLRGVLGDDTSSHDESFSDGLLEYPQYTRPETYKGKTVPEILLSGHHGEIEKWRGEQAKARTTVRRPDLLARKV